MCVVGCFNIKVTRVCGARAVLQKKEHFELQIPSLLPIKIPKKCQKTFGVLRTPPTKPPPPPPCFELTQNKAAFFCCTSF